MYFKTDSDIIKGSMKRVELINEEKDRDFWDRRNYNIQKENLFLSREIKTEKVKPSNIKKYNIGTWGIPVIIELIKGETIARVISESGFKI